MKHSLVYGGLAVVAVLAVAFVEAGRSNLAQLRQGAASAAPPTSLRPPSIVQPAAATANDTTVPPIAAPQAAIARPPTAVSVSNGPGMLDPRAEAEAAFFTDSAQKVREARDTRRLIEDTISKSPYKNVAARVNCKDVLCEIDVTCSEISTCNDEILRLFGPQHQVQLGGAVIVPTREQLGDGRSRVVAYLARSGDLPF